MTLLLTKSSWNNSLTLLSYSAKVTVFTMKTIEEIELTGENSIQCRWKIQFNVVLLEQQDQTAQIHFTCCCFSIWLFPSSLLMASDSSILPMVQRNANRQISQLVYFQKLYWKMESSIYALLIYTFKKSLQVNGFMRKRKVNIEE